MFFFMTCVWFYWLLKISHRHIKILLNFVCLRKKWDFFFFINCPLFYGAFLIFASVRRLCHRLFDPHDTSMHLIKYLISWRYQDTFNRLFQHLFFFFFSCARKSHKWKQDSYHLFCVLKLSKIKKKKIVSKR